MVDFLDSWVHIIPVWILDNILDQLIFPKLQKEVGPGGKWLLLVMRGAHLTFLSIASVLWKRLELRVSVDTATVLCHLQAFLSTALPKTLLDGSSFSWFLA